MEVMIGICAGIMSAIIVQLGTSYFKMAGYIPGRCHNKLWDKKHSFKLFTPGKHRNVCSAKPDPRDIPVLDDEAVLAANILALKHTLFFLGTDAIEDFTGTKVTLTRRNDLCDLMDSVIAQMPMDELERYIQKYSCDIRETGPYYLYTGPEDTRHGTWCDRGAYLHAKQMTPTGTIYLRHPNMDMICRVTDRVDMPGFIVSCKDSNGAKREFYIYLNKDCTDLKVCTNMGTNAVLDVDDRICVNYSVPFEDNQKA